MKFLHFFAPITLLFFYASILKTQPLITIEVSPDANNAICEIPPHALPDLAPNIMKYGDAPFYQFFLVIGDGNYYLRNGQMYSSSSMPYQITNPLLDVNNISYLAEGFLIDRKSDTEPPSIVDDVVLEKPGPGPIKSISSGFGSPADYINLNDYSTNKSPALLPITNPVTDYQRVKLAHSHYFLEKNDWSAFILAYHPMEIDQLKNPKLLFFIEEVFGKGTHRSSGYSNTPGHFIHKPNYFPGKPPLGLQDIPVNSKPADDFLGSPTTGPRYAYVNSYDIPSDDFRVDDPSDGYEELRLFHFLKSNDRLVDDQLYNFMIILTSDAPPPPDHIATDNYEDDKIFVADYIKEGDKKFRALPTSDVFYIDADTIQVRSGKPKDPNYLKVTDVCICSNDNYKVSFELQFCNIAPFPTSASSIFIKDQGTPQLFKCFEPVLANSTFKNTGAILNPTTCSGLGCKECQEKNNQCTVYDFCDGCQAQYCLSYNAILKNRKTIGNQNCHTFAFNVQTNRIGWGKLLKEKGLLKASVNFHETDCELVSSLSEAIVTYKDSINFDVNNIPMCNNVSRPCSDCAPISPFLPGWILSLLISLLVVGAFSWLYKRKR